MTFSYSTLIIKALAIAASCFFLFKFIHFYKRYKVFTDAVAKIPGIEGRLLPFEDNLRTNIRYYFTSRNLSDRSVYIYEDIMALCRAYRNEGICKYWLLNVPVIFIFSPELVESILSSTSQTTKSKVYFAFKPWLGEGLVTSSGTKWRSRRKTITPAFHFSILINFLPTIDAAATTLIKKLNNTMYSKSFDVSPIIASCTLDVICETAMGINYNFQLDGHPDWVTAIHDVTKISVARMTQPWLWFDWIFYRTETGKHYTKSLNCVRDLSMKVILERKAEWENQFKILKEQPIEMGLEEQARRADSDNNLSKELSQMIHVTNKYGNRMAFLDLLLYQHLVVKNLTVQDIQDEVDTFMFAGQDTTAVSICWTIYMLGLHQQIQDKARRELDEIFDLQVVEPEVEISNDLDGKIIDTIKLTTATLESLPKMKYLEMVIKETMRYWTTVPNISRTVTEDILLGGKYLIPAGCMLSVHSHALHHDPELYPNPYEFNPDRFSQENSSKRHPYAFTPFSAGPRNCIGQKFAMMEMKVILAKLIRNYRITSILPLDKLRVVGEVVLKSDSGLPIKLMPITPQPCAS